MIWFPKISGYCIKICKISSTTITSMLNQCMLRAYWNMKTNWLTWQAPRSQWNECHFNATTLLLLHQWKLYCADKHFSNKLNSVTIFIVLLTVAPKINISVKKDAYVGTCVKMMKNASIIYKWSHFCALGHLQYR